MESPKWNSTHSQSAAGNAMPHRVKSSSPLHRGRSLSPAKDGQTQQALDGGPSRTRVNGARSQDMKSGVLSSVSTSNRSSNTGAKTNSKVTNGSETTSMTTATRTSKSDPVHTPVAAMETPEAPPVSDSSPQDQTKAETTMLKMTHAGPRGAYINTSLPNQNPLQPGHAIEKEKSNRGS